MRKAKYSTEISPMTKLLTVEMACDRYKVSRTLLMRIAKDNNALIKLGRNCRFDIDVMDKVIQNY